MERKEVEYDKPLGLPFSYPGTKVRMRSILLPILEKIQRTCYVEPYCGAGGLFFGKPKERIEVLNDSNRAIINVFKTIRNKEKASDVCYLLETAPKSRAVWDELKPIVLKYMNGEDFSEEKRIACLNDFDDETVAAYAFLYVQNTCMLGCGIAVSYSAGERGYYSDKVLKYFQRAKKLLPLFADRLSNVDLENMDALDILRKYDDVDTLFFIDPPYHCSTAKQYRVGWTDDNERELVDVLMTIKGSYVLTVYDTEDYRRLVNSGGVISFDVNVIKTVSPTKNSEKTETIYVKNANGVININSKSHPSLLEYCDANI